MAVERREQVVISCSRCNVSATLLLNSTDTRPQHRCWNGEKADFNVETPVTRRYAKVSPKSVA